MAPGGRGTIYCFNTLSSSTIYKAGHTQTELAARLRGYLGPSKPRVMVFSREVDDSVEAERMMLTLMRQCVSLRSRDDLGKEWFEAVPEIGAEERHAQLVTIANVVALASRSLARVESGGGSGGGSGVESGVESGRQEGWSLGSVVGLESYFAGFDRYVSEVRDLSGIANVEELMRAYETSDSCPVMCAFLPHSPKVRLIAAGHRYGSLLR